MADKYQNKGFNKILNKVRAEKIMQEVYGETCLEIGAGEGQVTKYLLSKFKNVTVIDPNLSCFDVEDNHVLCLENELEKLEADSKYDAIVCTNVLEHVDDPEVFLDYLTKWAHEKTQIFISVPNAQSYNRLLGVDSGFISKPEELTEQDIDAGHKRMYVPKTFREDIEKKLDIQKFGTMIYKPFPNSIMEKLPNQVVKKCLSFSMNENGAEIYALCKLK
jgi:2-polyprenyl-3-methyl-5-hydroxy-6-metoxy-1,4-benzoquinol methylase